MPKVYFLSYARDRKSAPEANDLEASFERDLAKEVQAKLKQDASDVGFRDAGSIEAGTPAWSDELSRQIAEYPVGLVLLSPKYLQQDRPWYKWECLYLASRNSQVEQTTQDLLGHTPPRLLLIVEWEKPDDEDIPRDFPREVQRVGESIAGTDQDGGRAVRYILRYGLRSTLEQRKAGDMLASTAYQRFVQLLAAYIKDQWDRWRGFTHLGNVLDPPPQFDGGDCWASVNPISAGSPAKPRPDRIKRRKVYFVCLAALPEEVSIDRSWRYEEDGENDWQPFAGGTPDIRDRRLADYMADLRDVEINPWPFEYFKSQMADALSRVSNRYPILFVVDPYTACLKVRYREVLQEYVDGEYDSKVFCTPIVIWNDNDPQAEGLRNTFQTSVAHFFGLNRWEVIEQSAELTETLDAVIKSVRRRIRYVRADENPRGGSDPPRIGANA